MKDCRYLTGLAAAILFLVLPQCASVQELEAPRTEATGPSFEVFALPGDTKTVNDGLATLWQNGDRFNLFHADAGSKSYTADGAFTVDDPETGHAVGSMTSLSGAAHDWYLAYPYISSATSPAAVPVTIGASAGTAQVQAGAESTAHLAGPAVPLRGRVSAVAADATPSLTVGPAVSVLAIQVTNPGEADVKVTEVRFQAPEAIVGSFTMDITGASPVFQAVNASDEAVLSVSGGAVLKAGESGLFYLVVKPFSAGAGSQLKLSVNGQERTVRLSRPATFTTGKMKTLSVTLDPTDPPVMNPYYFRRVTAVTPGRKYLFVAEDAKETPAVLRMAKPLPEGTSSGRMDAEDVAEQDGIITLYGTENAFTFIQGENGFSIRQSDGRYLYNHNADNVYAGTDATAEYVWTVTFDEDGLASVANRTRMIQYNTTSSVRKYQTRQTSSSSTVGVKPRLYELQNDDEANAEFLKHTLPGVYAYGSEDWLYADGTHQTAVQTLASNVTFRLYRPADLVAVQVAGIPAGVSTGDRFSVRLTRYVKQALTHSGTFTVVAVKVADGTAWLMSDSGTGFIVKIQ